MITSADNTDEINILFSSFVRSTTMDKWKDSELERMKVNILVASCSFERMDRLPLNQPLKDITGTCISYLFSTPELYVGIVLENVVRATKRGVSTRFTW